MTYSEPREAADAIRRHLRRAEAAHKRCGEHLEALHEALGRVVQDFPSVASMIGGDVTTFSGGADKPDED